MKVLPWVYEQHDPEIASLVGHATVRGSSYQNSKDFAADGEKRD